MGGPDAKRLVVMGTAGTVGLALLRNVQLRQVPSATIPVGGFAAGVMLAVLAEVQPDIAAKMAVLMLATAAFVFGPDLWAGIAGAAAGKPVNPTEAASVTNGIAANLKNLTPTS